MNVLSTRRWAGIAALALVAVAAGCGGSSSSDTDAEAAEAASPATTADTAGAGTAAAADTATAETPAADTAVTEAVAASGCDAGGAEIVLVVPLRIPIVDQLLVGARKAGEDCNASFSDVGPQAFDPQAAIQAFQDAVAAGADALAFDALPPDIYARPVSETTIPMAQYISALMTENAPVYTGVNHFDVGDAIADLVIAKLPADASGEVVVANCAPGIEALDQRIDGIKQTFGRDLPSVTVEGPLETSQDPSQNFTIWQGIIQANPDALAFMGVCDQDLPSLTRIKSKDTEATYQIAGAEIQNVTLDGIKDGIVAGAVGQNPYLEGYIPIRLLAMILAGVEGTPTTGWVNPGLDIVTQENVDAIIERESSPEAAIAFYEPVVEEIFADLEAYTNPLSALNAPTAS